jgi:hypothetical protein
MEFNTEDVTEALLNDYGVGFGELSAMMKRAAPAKVVEGGLAETLASMQDPRFDPTMGWLSAPLLYSKIFAGRPKAFHRNVIRLIKGDFLRVWRRTGVPPQGSRAATETPGKSKWYEIVMNSEKF